MLFNTILINFNLGCIKKRRSLFNIFTFNMADKKEQESSFLFKRSQRGKITMSDVDDEIEDCALVFIRKTAATPHLTTIRMQLNRNSNSKCARASTYTSRRSRARHHHLLYFVVV